MAQLATVEQFADAVAAALGSRLVSLLLYGSAARGAHVPGRSDVNTLLICDAVDEALFDALGPSVRAWTRERHPAPLIFTEREWRDATDTFPIEYEDIRHAHRLLAGRDPLPGSSVRRDDLRRQLEHEVLGKLVRLRQAYATLQTEPKRLTDIFARSAAGFFTNLRAALWLAGKPAPAAPRDLVREAAALVGFPADGLAGVVAYVGEGRTLRLRPRDPLALTYLSAVARTAEYVNRLE